MRAAHYWNVWPPSKFYEASIEDQAIAIELYKTEMAISAYQSKVDQNSSRSGSASEDFVLDSD